MHGGLASHRLMGGAEHEKAPSVTAGLPVAERGRLATFGVRPHAGVAGVGQASAASARPDEAAVAQHREKSPAGEGGAPVAEPRHQLATWTGTPNPTKGAEPCRW